MTLDQWVAIVRELGSFGLLVVIVLHNLKMSSTQAARLPNSLDELTQAIRVAGERQREMEVNLLTAFSEHERIRSHHREEHTHTPRSVER